MSKRLRPAGFTIVELLIVIVVIGILAAITIVAFNGVTERSKMAALQTDLKNSYKQLELFRTASGTTNYPTALDCSSSPAANTLCLKASNGASFAYYVNNAISPAAYCLQETNGSKTFSLTATQQAPATTGCPAVTNTVTNPSLETNTLNWGAYVGPSPAAADALLMTDGGASGQNYYRMKWTVSQTSGSAGPYAYSNVAAPGETYVVSAYVRSNKARTIAVAAEWKDAASNAVTSGGTALKSSATVDIPAQTWTRVSVTTDAAPVSTAKFTATFYKTGTTSPFIAGDTFDIDGFMVTSGQTLYSYADGSTPNWSWTGASHASASSGIGL